MVLLVYIIQLGADESIHFFMKRIIKKFWDIIIGE